MKPFCEIMVGDVFPAVRAIIAKELTETLNYTQSDTARIMGVTQPAISQYKKEFRGTKVKILLDNEHINLALRQAARKLTTLKSPFDSHIMCDLCLEIRNEGLLCKLHRQAVPALSSCDTCMKNHIC